MKGSPNAPHYTTAKGALLGMTKALAVELAPFGIRVNAIAPPLIRTEMTVESLGADSPEWDKRAAAVPLGRPPGRPCRHGQDRCLSREPRVRLHHRVRRSVPMPAIVGRPSSAALLQRPGRIGWRPAPAHPHAATHARTIPWVAG